MISTWDKHRFERVVTGPICKSSPMITPDRAYRIHRFVGDFSPGPWYRFWIKHQVCYVDTSKPFRMNGPWFYGWMLFNGISLFIPGVVLRRADEGE